MESEENTSNEAVTESPDVIPKCGKKEPCGETGACGAAIACGGVMLDDDSNGDDEEPISRAHFIRLAFAGTVVAWGGVALAPVVAYLTPPPGEKEETTKITSVEVCKLSDLPKGTGRNFRFGSFPAVVVHDAEGQLHAFKAVCTHLGCTVQFRADKQCIYCACHGGEYDAKSGKNVAGPPPKPLPALKVAVVDDKIIVSKA
jgi:cytochrome b6-f complex iron-sulfur subunit